MALQVNGFGTCTDFFAHMNLPKANTQVTLRWEASFDQISYMGPVLLNASATPAQLCSQARYFRQTVTCAESRENLVGNVNWLVWYLIMAPT